MLRAGGRQFERGRNRTAHGIGERRRRGREAAESGGDGQEGGYGPDEVVEANGFGLPLRRDRTLDLLLGIVPLGADHVQTPREGLQVAPCHGQLLLLGLVLVTQLSVIGGVGRYVQVRDKGLPHLGGAGGGRPDGRGWRLRRRGVRGSRLDLGGGLREVERKPVLLGQQRRRQLVGPRRGGLVLGPV